MNIHELAELIGPPSCIIALDWPKALWASPDPGERGEPDWQRRASPSAGRTPRRHRRHRSAASDPLCRLPGPVPLPGGGGRLGPIEGLPFLPPARKGSEMALGRRQCTSLRPFPPPLCAQAERWGWQPPAVGPGGLPGCWSTVRALLHAPFRQAMRAAPACPASHTPRARRGSPLRPAGPSAARLLPLLLLKREKKS